MVEYTAGPSVLISICYAKESVKSKFSKSVSVKSRRYHGYIVHQNPPILKKKSMELKLSYNFSYNFLCTFF